MAEINYSDATDYFDFTTASGTTFAAKPNLIVNIKYVKSFSVVNEGTQVVEGSFDGINIHFTMTPSTSTSSLTFPDRAVTKIWFRTTSGSGSRVTVNAWSK